MIVNETLLVEIVRPGTGDPVAAGEVGEVVVTSFNPDYPMIRLATGDLSAVAARPLALRAQQHADHGLDGTRRSDHQGQGHVRASRRRSRRSAKRHPELGRLRLVVARAGEQDVMTLLAECAAPADGLQEAVAATLHSVTKLGGEVRLVAAGSLPNDGKVIADERPVG